MLKTEDGMDIIVDGDLVQVMGEQGFPILSCRLSGDYPDPSPFRKLVERVKSATRNA